MQKLNNKAVICGYVYDHSLELRTVTNEQSENYGTQYIRGSVHVAVDEDAMNVVEVNYTYEPEKFKKSGKDNSKFATLKKIIESTATWIQEGRENAYKVQIQAETTLNDFMSRDGEPISVKRIAGGFINIIPVITENAERNLFEMDFLITNVRRIEADPERNIPEDYCVLRGAAFNDFRKSILPMELNIRIPSGMEFFESTDASPTNPYFTKVWGKVNSFTTTYTKTEESAFGEARVKTYERKTKEWLITGSNATPYDFGDPAVMTDEDVTKMTQEREVYLADIARQNAEFKAQKNVAPAAAKVPSGGFAF